METARAWLQPARLGPRTVQTNDAEASAHFVDNSISNTKYNLLTFLPKNLMEQFSRWMNVYFLLIACLQLISEITPVNPLTTWLPLAVIFGVTAIKEGIDDLGRRRADGAANERLYRVIREGREGPLPSYQIRVGDIVRLGSDEEVPCDCVLLASSDKHGNAFIQTTNLDGESNLKQRSAPPATRHSFGRGAAGPASSSTMPYSLSAVGALHLAIQCPAPDEHIYRFDAQMQLLCAAHGSPAAAFGEGPGGAVVALTSSQLLLQATHVRNTEWLLAVAVYTGNETKFGHNKRRPPTKYTRTDAFINGVSAAIFALQLLLVVAFGAVGDVWANTWNARAWYLGVPDTSPSAPLVIPARFLLLNSTMIPISLKLTMDLCKLFYAKFIEADVGLYDASRDAPAVANSTALSEDLGQVRVILTDKTGTLTENRMVLRGVTVRGLPFGEAAAATAGGAKPHPHYHSHLDAVAAGTGGNGGDAAFQLQLQAALAAARSQGMLASAPLATAALGDVRAVLGARASSSPSSSALLHDGGAHTSGALDLLRCLALNNDVVPAEPRRSGPPGADAPPAGPLLPPRVYNASSPDEEALVKAAAAYGVALWERDGDDVTISLPSPAPRETYTQLAVAEFTSDRKRMSVVLRSAATGNVRVYCKGADDVVLALLAPDADPGGAGSPDVAATRAGVDEYAAAGLRTLVYAFRDLSAEQYAAFATAHAAAAAAMLDREAAMEEVFCRHLETDLRLLGATAIEDKLQEGVAPTLSRLRTAGISFWMLTGDKFSTALTIARTCGLLPPDTQLVEIGGEGHHEVAASLRGAASALAAAGHALPYGAGALTQEADASVADRLIGHLVRPVRRSVRSFGEALGVSKRGAGALAASLHEEASHSQGGAPPGLVALGRSKAGGAAAAAGSLTPAVGNAYRELADSSTAAAGARPSLSNGGSRVAPAPTSPQPLARLRVPGSPPRPYCVIIRGATLVAALSPDLVPELRAVCGGAQSVIACRVTPKQKAACVRMVKSTGALTLAIGDGGNDVAMIQEAHVGVGIAGAEGLQAARAADYVVTRFKALRRLLLVHGRYSYYRTALVAQYSFYKSFLFCVLQIGYGFYSGFAGVSLFNSLCVAAYNAVLFVPIVFFLVDRDITQRTALRHPIAYRMCNGGSLMTAGTMLVWLLRGLLQAIIVLLFGLYSASHSKSSDYESMGLLIFMAYMWVQDFTMLFAVRRATWYNVISIFGMHLLAVCVAAAMNATPRASSFIDYYSLFNTLSDPVFWLANAAITVAAIIPVQALAFYQAAFDTASFTAALGRLDGQIEAKYYSETGAALRGLDAAAPRTGAAPGSGAPASSGVDLETGVTRPSQQRGTRLLPPGNRVLDEEDPDEEYDDEDTSDSGATMQRAGGGDDAASAAGSAVERSMSRVGFAAATLSALGTPDPGAQGGVFDQLSPNPALSLGGTGGGFSGMRAAAVPLLEAASSSSSGGSEPAPAVHALDVGEERGARAPPRSGCAEPGAMHPTSGASKRAQAVRPQPTAVLAQGGSRGGAGLASLEAMATNALSPAAAAAGLRGEPRSSSDRGREAALAHGLVGMRNPLSSAASVFEKRLD